MREEPVSFHLYKSEAGTSIDLGLRKFISTCVDERTAWAKLSAQIDELAEHEGDRPKVCREPPFDGRVISPWSSGSEEAFLVLSKQAHFVMFDKTPAAYLSTANPAGETLSFEQWSKIPESIGQLMNC